ncbi:MAG: UTRA domain-containing protein [Pseudonocardiaceae bacterium]|nr:UTRA domain-containing protein [Pseudonocardiaceae bacterium]
MARQAAKQLDRSSPLPLWAQLHEDLERRLGAGAFETGFPSEYELVEDYQVSRHTVREALRRLRQQEVLDSARGRGTWVRKPRIEQPLGALYSLFRSVEALGMEQHSVVRILELRTDETVARRLQRAESTEFVYLERLRLADGEPLALDHAWLPRSIAEPLLDADFSHSGLYDELAVHAGTRLTGGREVIEAVVPTASQRKVLKIPAGTAAMAIERLGCLRDEPTEWRQTLVRADRFRLLAQWSSGKDYRMDVSGGAPSAPSQNRPGQ